MALAAVAVGMKGGNGRRAKKKMDVDKDIRDHRNTKDLHFILYISSTYEAMAFVGFAFNCHLCSSFIYLSLVIAKLCQ